MNSQTKPEIGRKKPQKPKKATFTKGCAVSSGGGGGTIEIMNKAVKMMMNEGLNEDEMKKTKIGRAHVRTPVTSLSRMPSSA